MPKKLTYEFVKSKFEEKGYTLLSKEYINNKTKLNCICPKGHTYYTTWDSWKGGHGCPLCSGNVKLTYESVKNSFEKAGYTLLSKEYKNVSTKLNYICQNGHTHSITFSDWQRGYKCPHCHGNAKNTFEEVKLSFEAEGYTLFSKTYKNSKTKLKYRCPNGHEHHITWNSWTNGYRCPYCYGNAKHTIDEIRKSFVAEGYTLLSTEYLSCNSKLEYKCPGGHRHSILWDSWQRGVRCPYCYGNGKPSYYEVKTSFEKEGYTLLSTEYISSQKHLSYLCSYGHKHTMSWGHWTQGKRCPTCWYISNSGDKHYNWQGGKSLEGYCPVWKDKEYKSDIRDRDGNRCLNPYCDSKDPNDLTIHHIDYDKKNCHPSNLITVCRSCNSKANTDRTWHKYWYQAIIYRRSLV